MTERQGRRNARDRVLALFVVLLAIGAGVVAGALGKEKPWERPAAQSTTTLPGG
ncbi:MAG TPA: hypothetical protein VFR41_03380 [Acidimicrobiia bacterium]|nr:hypothetical protein [Acidimicrobiia bacterium]